MNEFGAIIALRQRRRFGAYGLSLLGGKIQIPSRGSPITLAPVRGPAILTPAIAAPVIAPAAPPPATSVPVTAWTGAGGTPLAPAADSITPPPGKPPVPAVTFDPTQVNATNPLTPVQLPPPAYNPLQVNATNPLTPVQLPPAPVSLTRYWRPDGSSYMAVSPESPLDTLNYVAPTPMPTSVPTSTPSPAILPPVYTQPAATSTEPITATRAAVEAVNPTPGVAPAAPASSGSAGKMIALGAAGFVIGGPIGAAIGLFIGSRK